MDSFPLLRNAAAGAGGADDDLRAALDGAGVRADFRQVPAPELADEARRLSRAGAPLIAVSGGDGTVSAVAGALAGSDTRLVVFPGGTLNHFAAALGIRTHADTLRGLAANRFQAVDVGEVNGRVFVNGASIGLYPRQLRIRSVWQPRIGKWPAAAVAGIATLAGFPRRRVTLEGEGMKEEQVTALVWIGPGRGSFRDPVAAPRELGSGVLEVVMIGARSRLRLLQLGMRAALHGRDALRIAEEAEDCQVHTGPWFTLGRSRPHRVDIGVDGELVQLMSPLEFRLLPGALQVCVAPPLPEGEEAAED
ncbi:MAG TPA: diacylglycerol kinase family protein [Longimicrobiaceae bacterium]|nr:diacylglycerol kinase family protein [Longimicrobiaceae bacterium]